MAPQITMSLHSYWKPCLHHIYFLLSLTLEGWDLFVSNLICRLVSCFCFALFFVLGLFFLLSLRQRVLFFRYHLFSFFLCFFLPFFLPPFLSFSSLQVILKGSLNTNQYHFSSVTQSCPTLCHPMNRSTPGLPVHHQLLEFTQTHIHWVSDAIQPSHPLSSPSPPAPNPSQHQSLFQWVNSLH